MASIVFTHARYHEIWLKHQQIKGLLRIQNKFYAAPHLARRACRARMHLRQTQQSPARSLTWRGFEWRTRNDSNVRPSDS